MDAEEEERGLFAWITKAFLVAGLVFIGYASFKVVAEKRERRARMAGVEERTQQLLEPAREEIERLLLELERRDRLHQ